MRSVLYIIRKPPSVLANEVIDMMLVSGVFDQPARVLFIGDGALQLNARQDAALVGRKDTTRALAALATYGVGPLYAHQPSLAARAIALEAIALPVTLVEDAGLPALLGAAQVVVTD